MPVVPRPAHLARPHDAGPGAVPRADARDEVLGGGDAELVQDVGDVVVEVVILDL